MITSSQGRLAEANQSNTPNTRRATLRCFACACIDAAIVGQDLEPFGIGYRRWSSQRIIARGAGIE